MSSLRRDLFERRLWPLVIVLLAAIVAVPLLMHGNASGSVAVLPAPTTAATAPATGSTGTAHGSVVAIRRRLRRISLQRDPFLAGVSHLSKTPSSSSAQATTTTASASPTSASDTATTSSSTSASVIATTTSDGSPTTVASSAGGSAGNTPVVAPTTTTTTVTTAAPTTAPTSTDGPLGRGPWTIYSVAVRFATPSYSAQRHDLARLEPLPSVASPRAMFIGVMDKGQDAVFALADGVQAVGPGVCRPTHAQCSQIVLSVHQTEHLSYLNPDGSTGTVALAVSDIAGAVTHSPKRALVAYRRSSRAGQCERDLAAPIQYDQAKGSAWSVAVAACRKLPKAVPFPGSPDGA